MILAEQERILGSEKRLLSKFVPHWSPKSYGLIYDYGNITTSEAGIVIFNFTVTGDDSGLGIVVLYINGIPVEFAPVLNSDTHIFGGAIWLPAGTYDVAAYGQYSGTSAVSISDLEIGFAQFNDCTAYALQASSNCSLTGPSARNTPIGPINQVVYAINASALAPVGEVVDAPIITVDGVQQTNDEGTSGYHAQANSAKCYLPLSPGVSHSISITCNNGSATLYLSVIACPWILTTALRHGHSPVTIDLPQSSTIYTNLGSLFIDSTKNAYIGMQKGLSFGISDFYAYGTTDAGILSFSYTFTTVDVAAVAFIADGLGGCIENIGIDTP